MHLGVYRMFSNIAVFVYTCIHMCIYTYMYTLHRHTLFSILYLYISVNIYPYIYIELPHEPRRGPPLKIEQLRRKPQ